MRGFWDGQAWLLWALAAALAVLFAWLDYAGHLGSPAVEETSEQDGPAQTSDAEPEVARQDWVEFEVTEN